MAEQKKPLWRRVHDATCLGHIAKVGILQQICPVCRTDRGKAQAGPSGR